MSLLHSIDPQTRSTVLWSQVLFPSATTVREKTADGNPNQFKSQYQYAAWLSLEKGLTQVQCPLAQSSIVFKSLSTASCAMSSRHSWMIGSAFIAWSSMRSQPGGRMFLGFCRCQCTRSFVALVRRFEAAADIGSQLVNLLEVRGNAGVCLSECELRSRVRPAGAVQ